MRAIERAQSALTLHIFRTLCTSFTLRTCIINHFQKVMLGRRVTLDEEVIQEKDMKIAKKAKKGGFYLSDDEIMVTGKNNDQSYKVIIVVE
jgi:hypothetical protein